MSVFAALFGVDDASSSGNQSAGTSLKIETGSYTGDGKYGEANPNTITLEIEPKIVYVFLQHYFPCTSSLNEQLDEAVASQAEFYYVDGEENGVFPVVASGVVLGEVTYEMSGKNLSWYSDSAACQFNRDDTTYYYIAIGT